MPKRPAYSHHPFSIHTSSVLIFGGIIKARCQPGSATAPISPGLRSGQRQCTVAHDLTEVIELTTLQNCWAKKGEDGPAPIFRWFIYSNPSTIPPKLQKLALRHQEGFVGMIQKTAGTHRGKRRKKKQTNLFFFFFFFGPGHRNRNMLRTRCSANLLWSSQQRSMPRRPVLVPYCTYSRTITIVPPHHHHGSLIPDGPLPNNLVASCVVQEHDCFLRVTFQDKKTKTKKQPHRMALRHDTTLKISIKSLLHSRYRKAFVKGSLSWSLHFEFLGYSMRGLSSSVFFVQLLNLSGSWKDIDDCEVSRGNIGAW